MGDRKEYFAEYYKNNKDNWEEYKKRTALYYEENPDKKKLANKKYRDKVNPNRKKRV